MRKKLIAAILTINILSSYLPMILVSEVEAVEVASTSDVTTQWEYNYTGGEQTFKTPYKGIYKIEAYGAQGGTVSSAVTGGKGNYVVGTAQFDKDTNLAIYVGGQNGYNGGGSSSSYQGVGGGASDIRYNGTGTANRILVAAGGGGAYARPNYHSHTSSCNHTHTDKTGSCYTKSTTTCGKTCGASVNCVAEWDNGSHSNCQTNFNCPTHGLVTSDGGHSSRTVTCTKQTTTYTLTCTKVYDCGKTTSTIESYTYINGKSTASSNNTAYKGSTGGGGGYYGGTTQYAGTSYTSANFSEVTQTQGAKLGDGYVKITLLESYPEVSLSANTTQYTKGDVLITAKAKDDVIGLAATPYSWNGTERISANTYLAKTNGTYNVSVLNNYDNTETASIDIEIIDKINPKVDRIEQTIKNDRQVALTVYASDTATSEYAASGIVGYAITTTESAPTNFQSSNQFTVTKNGTYYAWAKDAVGNISSLSKGEGKSTIVKDIEINVEGNIIWNDQNNRYTSRKSTNIHLYRKVGENGREEKVANVAIQEGQTSYSFQTRECDENGNQYIFRVEQDYMPGYETLYQGNSVTSVQTQKVTIGITNNLILPGYTSKIEYNLIDSFRGEYLKNTELEMTATIQANSSNRDKTGLNQSKVTYLIDEGFTIDKNNIKVTYTDGITGKETIINDYILQKNNLTISYGVGGNKVTKAGDKLIIKITGVFSQIKQYQNSITLTGNLTDYKGTNTNINLGEVTKTEKNFEVKYQKPQARIQIQKRDSITEEKLVDATFTLYEWNGTEYVEKEILTDEDQDGIYTSNYYEWTSATSGKYRIAETGIPLNHKNLSFSMEYSIDQLKEDNYTITPDYDNGAYRIAYTTRNPDDFDRENKVVENEPFKVKVSIENKDKETKETIQSNATYTIYEWDRENQTYKEYISKTNGNKVEMVRADNKIYLSSQWLYYTNNNEGKYKIVETVAPYGYYGDYEGQNKREYEINILEAIESGKYENQNIDNESTIRIFNNEEKTAIENQREKTRVNIQIIDKETRTNKTQASATLEGAEYGIYAKEPINHADGITSRYPGEAGILYKKDELVKTVTTDQEGKITIEDLECGIYYVKQQNPPEGYLEDTNTYELVLTYEGQEKALIELNAIYENTVKKQAFQILKQQTIGKNETAPLANAGFTIYEIKELSIVKEGKISKNTDGTYSLNDETAKKDNRITKKANGNGTYNIEDIVDYYYKINYTEDNMQILPQGENAYYPYKLEGEKLVLNYVSTASGQEITEMITGQNGYLKSPELAYGEYVVIESGVPHQKEAITPITIKITNDSRQAQNLKYIIDPNFETKIKIYTKDIETGKTILKENAKFIIKNTDTGELITYRGWSLFEGNVEYGTYENPFCTTRKGYIVTPMKLQVGNYELIQLQSPEGYILNGYEGYSHEGEIVTQPQKKVSFKIGTNQMYFIDDELESNVIVTIQENKAQVGTLQVSITGEKLTEVDKKQKPYSFKYEKQNLEGIELGLYAKEDIYAQDEQQTKLYNKDELVQRKTTNIEGKLNYDNIPIGNYYVKEISTINGFSLNQETKEVSITYGSNEVEIEAQKTPVTKYQMEKEDIRQKVSIIIVNKDEQTGEPIQGTEIGLYAKEDITNKEGTVIVEKDECIEEQTTNEEGKIVITSDLPLGNYYAKQIKAATGYVENKNIIDIDATYKQDARAVINIEKEMQNRKTTIYVKPIDEEGNIVEKSNLQIVDEQGTVIGEWTSSSQPQEIQKLEVEKTYILKQGKPKEGYVSIEEIPFCIKENGELEQQVSDEKNTLKPVHYTTKLEIYLKDKETKENLQGIRFEIIRKAETNKEDYTDGEIQIEEFTISSTGYQKEKIPIGRYILRQKQEQQENIQNQGYVQLPDIEFEIKDTKEIQTLIVEQGYTKLELEVFDKQTKEKIPEVRFEIYKQKTKEDGSKILGEKIEEFITTKENAIIARLAVGNYILKQAPSQEKALYEKGYVTNQDIEIEIKDKDEVQKISIGQEESKLEIELIDELTKEKVAGTTMQIIDQQTGKVVEEFTTNVEANKTISKMPLGNYILRYKEVNLEKGYVKGEDIAIQLIDTVKTQKAEIKQDYTNIEIKLLDKDTKEGIMGATLAIVDKEGKEIGESWITDGKAYRIAKVPVGEYYLQERLAPTLKGYVRTEKIFFKVEQTGEIQIIEMLQDYTQIKIELKDEKTKEVIKDVELVIKDEKGNEIAKIATKEEAAILEKLPVGKYIIESIKVPYGYKPIKMEIEIKDKQGIQNLDNIKLEREEFDLKVEEWIKKIERNGQTEYENIKDENKMKKVDVKDKKIRTEDIKVTYKIRVSNVGKIIGQVGKVEVSLPQGMKFEPADNKTYWKEEAGKVVTTGLAGRDLAEGAYADIEIVLRWKNGLENFGTKEAIVEIKETKSDIGFDETNLENNKAKTDVIIGVSTGEMNLVYGCWFLLMILILIEVYVSRKLKIKEFAIKDRTLRHKK